MARIDIDVSGLSAMQKLLDPAQFRKDVAAGLKYSIPSARRTAAKEIGAKYAIPAARIKADIKSIKYDDDGLTFTFSRLPPSLRSYGGKPTGSRTTKKLAGVPIGVKYRVFKGIGGTQKRDNAFWLQVAGLPFPGLPFRRKGPGSSGLFVLRGPSIGSIFVGKSAFGEQIRKATTDVVQVQFGKGVEREQRRRVKRY